MLDDGAMKIPEILMVETVHQPGSLVRVLQVIADAGLAIEHLTAVRRDQGKTREHVPILRPTEDGPVQVHPLATMTAAAAQTYMLAHGIPEHPLKARRYLSIGCWPCTQPVPEGEDERAGRWAGTAKTECGIHTSLKAGEA